MVKRVVIYSLQEGAGPDAFWRYHTEVHSDDFKKVVGSKLKKYVMNRVTAHVGGELKFFALIETWWESEEAMNEAYKEAKIAKTRGGKTVFDDFMSQVNLLFAGSVEEMEIEL